MNLGYLAVATTVVMTVYGQFIIKWQVDRAGEFPTSTGDRVRFFVDLVLNPWTISAFAGAGIAAVAWMGALTRLELGRAYPILSLSFVLALIGGAVFFDEPLTWTKTVGVGLVVVGLVVASQ